MTQFVKAFDKHAKGFQYVFEIFPGLSETKIKESTFNGVDVKKVVIGFLGKAENYKKLNYYTQVFKL